MLLSPAQNHEIDDNGDGLYDELRLHMSVPLRADEQVTGAQLILLFDYKLQVGHYRQVRRMDVARKSSSK